MSKHEKFILTPVTSVIEEMKSATACIGNGIETYPFWDYIIQATFTKMTGFMEQKAKCIDWELATNGFEYRRTFIDMVNKRGTYSKYDAKNDVYNALLNEIRRYSGKERREVISQVQKNASINPRQIVQDYIGESNIVYYNQRDFNEFRKCDKKFKNQFLLIPEKEGKTMNLFESSLHSYYDDLVDQRNRIAHNTLSYQQNLPELGSLQNEKDFARNYFFWFSILVLIDEIFMVLYKLYSQCLECNSYFKD